jgi:Flp pilus assembly protein TadD
MPETLASTAASASVAPLPHRRVRRPLLLALYWPVVLGLVALNGWWWWDARPMPPLKLVEQWIGIEREPGNRVVAWWDFGDVSRDNSGAISALRRAVRKSPNDGEARLLLGRALGAAKDYAGCAEELRQVPFWSPRKLEARFGEGMALLELNRAREAEATLLAYLAVDRNHPSPRPKRVVVENKLWDIYALEDRWEDARALAWRAYKDADDQPRVQLKILEVIMRTHLEQSRPDAAVARLGPILEADPTDWEARRALARALDAVGEHAEADRQIAACLAERPKSPRAWADRLDMLEAREDFAALAAAEAKVPPEAEVEGRIWMTRGLLRRQARDYPGAVQAFAKALERMPSDIGAHHNLGQALQAIGKTAEAEVHRRRHAELLKLSQSMTQAVNHYRDLTDSATTTPAALREAMAKIAADCRGMGWADEAAAWAKAAKAYP